MSELEFDKAEYREFNLSSLFGFYFPTNKEKGERERENKVPDNSTSDKFSNWIFFAWVLNEFCAQILEEYSRCQISIESDIQRVVVDILHITLNNESRTNIFNSFDFRISWRLCMCVRVYLCASITVIESNAKGSVIQVQSQTCFRKAKEK